MWRQIGAIIVGVGFEVVFLILNTQVKEMPIEIAVAGYVIGGLLILYGAVCMFVPLKNIWEALMSIRIRSPVFLKKDYEAINHVPSWLEQELASDLERILKGMLGRTIRWDFSKIYDRDAKFEIHIELTNTTIFAFHLKGFKDISGYMAIAREKCSRKPDISPHYNIKRDKPVVVRITQAIDKETAKLIETYGNTNREIEFDLRELVFEFENALKDYENNTPYLCGGIQNIVPKEGLKKVKPDMSKHLKALLDRAREKDLQKSNQPSNPDTEDSETNKASQ
jgi:hypothetical protein